MGMTKGMPKYFIKEKTQEIVSFFYYNYLYLYVFSTFMKVISLLDELRYYLMTKPFNPPPKREKNEIQKDKERLYRKILNERKKFKR